MDLLRSIQLITLNFTGTVYKRQACICFLTNGKFSAWLWQASSSLGWHYTVLPWNAEAFLHFTNRTIATVFQITVHRFYLNFVLSSNNKPFRPSRRVDLNPAKSPGPACVCVCVRACTGFQSATHSGRKTNIDLIPFDVEPCVTGCSAESSPNAAGFQPLRRTPTPPFRLQWECACRRPPFPPPFHPPSSLLSPPPY
jgi:hypothetical protein